MTQYVELLSWFGGVCLILAMSVAIKNIIIGIRNNGKGKK